MQKIAAIIFILIAAISFISAWYSLEEMLAFKARASSAVGTVIAFSLSKYTDKKGITKTMYTPIVTYTPEAGLPVKFKGGFSSNPPSFSIGDAVEVLYDKANPADAKINSFMQLWFKTVFLSGTGLVFLGISVVFMRIPAKKKHKTPELSGHTVDAEIISVEPEMQFDGGDMIWIIQAQWIGPDMKVQRFRSHPLKADPSSKLGKTVKVFIYGDRPDEYRMDV